MKSRVFDISVRETAVGVVVACSGEIDISSSEQLEEALGGIAATKPASVTLDLSAVTFIDSSGIRCLVLFAKTLRRDGIALQTIASQPVLRVCEVLGVTAVLGIEAKASAEEAI